MTRTAPAYTSATDTATAQTLGHLAILQDRYPGATITRSRRLMGDALRWGWWAVFPDEGSDIYLGCSLADAVHAGLDADV